jgi:hypothetical protein
VKRETAGGEVAQQRQIEVGRFVLQGLHFLGVGRLHFVEQVGVLDQRGENGSCHGIRLIDGLPINRNLRREVGLRFGRALLRHIVARDLLELLLLMLQQRAQYPLLGAKLMQQSTLADAAFTRQRIERQSTDAFAGQDGKSGIDCLLAGDLRTGLVIHCR